MLSEPATRPLKYMPQLDSLRAFAVAGVMALHFHQNSKTGPLGVFGVRLFFVLSGFLITGILLDCRSLILEQKQTITATLTRFYVRRFLRIIPVFYLVVALAWLLGVPAARAGLLWHIGYASNFYTAHVQGWPAGVGHFWSLAVEEQFYLIWPFVICSIGRRRAVEPIILTTVVSVIFGRMFLRSHLSHPWYLNMSPLGSIETLGLGSLLAAASRSDSAFQKLIRPCLLASLFAGSALFILRFILKSHNALFEAIPQELMYALLGVWTVGIAAKGFPGVIGKILLWKPLRAMGTISYGIYLYHNLVPFTIAKCIGKNPDGWRWQIAFCVISIVVATISWLFFEKPINAMKRRFPYRILPNPAMPAAIPVKSKTEE